MADALYGKRYSQTVLNDAVDFVKIAEAMGAKAYRVTQKEELEPVLRGHQPEYSRCDRLSDRL